MHLWPCRLLLATALLATGGPAVAQDTDDWDFGQDPARNLAVAAVTFEHFGIAVRCVNGSLSVVMSGMPRGSGERTFRVGLGDVAVEETRWVSAEDSGTAFALWPRTLARRLRGGGRLHVEAVEAEAVRLYDVEVPASARSIGLVFEACGQSVEQPIEDIPGGESFAGMRWRHQPEIRFPDRATVSHGLAALDCLLDRHGSFRDCQVESEFPEGSGFGRAAVLGTHRAARVEPLVRGESVEGRRVSFVARYRMAPSPGFGGAPGLTGRPSTFSPQPQAPAPR